MNKDYYEILGIKKDADDKAIKKAFRSLSKKFHPDKFVNKSEKEKQEAEERFKEINEAYSVLSDEKKKKQYDTYGKVGEFPSDIDDILRQMDEEIHGFTGRHSTRHQRIVKGQTKIVNVYVTLEELYNNSEINVKYKRLVPCSECNGKGSKNGEETICSHCKGKGILQQRFVNGNSVFMTNTTCPHCQGQGTIIKEPCEKCSGFGLEEREENINIKIPVGCSDGMGISIDCQGNFPPNGKGIPGDLEVIFYVKPDTIYSIDPNNRYNIIRTLELPILDCITGCTCEINSFNDKKYKIPIKPNTLHNSMLRLRGNGLNNPYGERGDMLICVKMKMPKLPLTTEENELIGKLKQTENFK